MQHSRLCIDFERSFFKVSLLREAFFRILFSNPFKGMFCLILYFINRENFYTQIFKTLSKDYIENIPLQKVAQAKLDEFEDKPQNIFFFSRQASLLNQYKFNFYNVSNLIKPIHELSQENDRAVVLNQSRDTSSLLSQILILIKQCRVYQWVKNLLIFLPIITSYTFYNVDLVLSASVVFLFFSFVASSVYIFNDILDLEQDREHSEKKHRPLASGIISTTQATIFAFALLSVGLIGSFLYNFPAFKIIFGYVALNFIYTKYAKKSAFTDVFFLCSFYMIRLFLGSATTGIILSQWLFGFAFFLFLGLAFMKRYIEVSKYLSAKHNNTRTYSKEDSIILLLAGINTSISSSVILALYINEQVIKVQNKTSGLLWSVLVVFLFSLLRMWFMAHKKEIDSDPVKFILKDFKSLISLLLVFVIFILSYKNSF